jgi:hypothetical protein
MLALRDKHDIRIRLKADAEDWLFQEFRMGKRIFVGLRTLERLWAYCYGYNTIASELQAASGAGVEAMPNPEEYQLAFGILDWASQKTLADIEGPWPELNAQSHSDLINDKSIPPLFRLYILGINPQVFLSNRETAQSLAERVKQEADIKPLQRLVARKVPAQHEILKPYVLAGVASLWDWFSKTVSIQISNERLIAILNCVQDSCRVVPGVNANWRFEFGRDALLSTTADGLLSVILHETTHWIV